MEIKQLQHFVAICEYKSFGKAAKHCFISVQGISVSIGRLEEELECKLFERTTTGAELTIAGEYLLPKAKEILKQVSLCKEYYSQRNSKKMISIMLVRGTVEHFGRPCIKRFMDENPNVEVDFRVGSDTDCQVSVENGSVDFAICAGPYSEEVQALRIFNAPCVAAISQDHPFAKKKQISVKDLDNRRLAILGEDMSSTKALFRLAAAYNIHINYTTVDEPRLAMYKADMGKYLGIINPISASKLQFQNISLIPFKEKEMRWDINLIRLKDKEMSKEALAFEKIVEDFIAVNK